MAAMYLVCVWLPESVVGYSIQKCSIRDYYPDRRGGDS